MIFLGSNFSHRIDKFSFGENCELVHNALNHELKVTNLANIMYQYFISVVTTDVSNMNAFQYSVTEKVRNVFVNKAKKLY